MLHIIFLQTFSLQSKELMRCSIAHRSTSVPLAFVYIFPIYFSLSSSSSLSASCIKKKIKKNQQPTKTIMLPHPRRLAEFLRNVASLPEDSSVQSARAFVSPRSFLIWFFLWSHKFMLATSPGHDLGCDLPTRSKEVVLSYGR
jgi:hypothetical protein